MARLEDVLAMVEAGRDEVIALTQDLVRLNTVSTGVMPTGNEIIAANFLAEKLRAEGIEEAPSWRARRHAAMSSRLFLGRAKRTVRSGLSGHTDVVPVEDPTSGRSTLRRRDQGRADSTDVAVRT